MRTHNLTRAGIVATVAAALITIPTAALADEGTVWEAWIMPNDGTDWPQTIASEANLAALPCGTTWRIQNDQYLPAERDRFVADGVLNYGEDFGSDAQRGAISWYFTEYTTPACVIDVNPVTPTIVQASGSCVNGAWTETAATVTYPYVENGQWENGLDGQTITLPAGEYADRFTTAEGNYRIPEGRDYYLDNGWAVFSYTIAGLPAEDCTVSEPEPTDTPVPQPAPTAVPQAVEADAAGAPSTRAASATTLAETGPEEDATIRLIIGAVVLVIAGTALTIGRRKQGNR